MKTKKMIVGVLSGFGPELENPFTKIVGHGVDVTQVCNWKVDLWTKENAKKIKKYAKDSKIRINSFWSGYTGPAVWNFIEGPTTLGLVPPEYRKQRIADLKKGADFAEMIGAPAIVTHCGFIPEYPADPLYQGTLDAIGEVAEYCKKKGLGFWHRACGEMLVFF